jgi:DNA-binding CsgD family transcriptional regulator
LLALRGDFDEAARRLGAIDVDVLDPDTAAFFERVKAELELNRDRPAEAADAADRGLARLDDALWCAPLVALGLRALAEIADTARAAHDEAAVGAATRRASSLVGRLDAMAPRARTPGARAWIDSARVEHLRVEGRAAPPDWDAIATTWDAVPDLLEGAYARYRAAEAALRETGVRADVGAALRAAYHATHAMGARPLEAAIAGLARRARISVDEPVTGDGHEAVAVAAQPVAAALPGGLSPREVEVLRLVAAGRSNGEIAERLFITRKTAGVHVTHILDKLGVSNRVEAAMAAARLGLLPDGDDER